VGFRGYHARAGVEGTLAQGLRVCDLHRARYVGLAKTHLQHVLTAAAVNVRRLGQECTEPQAVASAAAAADLVGSADALGRPVASAAAPSRRST
jgi:hypothetical protein